MDHGHPDTVLDTAKGIEKLAFQEHHGFNASGDFAQTNERGGDPRFR
jgi:hypothetical protein